MVACHRDDDPENNDLDNLYWGTQSQNYGDALANGRSLIGRNSPNAKTNELDIAIMRYLHARGAPKEAIALVFGICYGNAKDLINNPCDAIQEKQAACLAQQMVREAYRRICENK
jgi:hypothetical protein